MTACSLTYEHMEGSSKKERKTVIFHTCGEQEETLEGRKSQWRRLMLDVSNNPRGMTWTKLCFQGWYRIKQPWFKSVRLAAVKWSDTSDWNEVFGGLWPKGEISSTAGKSIFILLQASTYIFLGDWPCGKCRGAQTCTKPVFTPWWSAPLCGYCYFIHC